MAKQRWLGEQVTTFSRFEDIEAWKLAREIARKVYAASSHGEFGRDYGLKDQTRRAAVSIMANIAEGYERGGNREFLQFLATAKGSVGELRSHLYVVLDQGYLPENQIDQMRIDCMNLSAMLQGLINHLRESDYRGSKYKHPPENR